MKELMGENAAASTEVAKQTKKKKKLKKVRTVRLTEFHNPACGSS